MQYHRERSPIPLVIASLAILGAGCFLPVSTAQPQSATTLGKGGKSVTTHAEFPTIDLVATQTDSTSSDDDYALAPLPTMTLGLGFGLSDDFDLMAGIDTVLYIVIPLPLGAWIGGRFQLQSSEQLDVALTGRTGFVTLSGEDDVDELRASYAQVGVIAQAWPTRGFRPVAAFTIMPAFVQNTLKDEAPESFTTLSMNLTLTAMLAAGPIEFGPFVNLVYFRSPNLAGSTIFPTGGIMFGLRSRKPRKQAAQRLPQAPPPAPTPVLPDGPPGAPR